MRDWPPFKDDPPNHPPKPRVSEETQRVVTDLDVQIMAARAMWGDTPLSRAMRAAATRLLTLETGKRSRKSRPLTRIEVAWVAGPR